MKHLHQLAFERLYEISKAHPNARVEEHVYHWYGDRYNGPDHINHQIILSGTLNGCSYLITFEDDPLPDAIGFLEVFLAYKNAVGDITIKPKSVFELTKAFLTGRLIRNLPASLEKLLIVTCPQMSREGAKRFIQNPRITEALLQFPWSELQSLKVCDGAGFSVRHPAKAVRNVSPAWVEEQLSMLGHPGLTGWMNPG